MEVKKFDELIGHYMASVTVVKSTEGDELIFVRTDGKKFRFWHNQDCCEYVYIEDICGDLQHLTGAKILVAEERTQTNQDPDCRPQPDEDDNYADSSYTWTFYEFATIEGSVTIRWFGSSNGYYSESVDFEEVKE